MIVDVLNLEWTSYLSRDRVSATLICNYLRYCGLNVVEKSIFNGFYFINKFKRKILFMTNTCGAEINQEIARYAKSNGRRVPAVYPDRRKVWTGKGGV